MPRQKTEKKRKRWEGGREGDAFSDKPKTAKAFFLPEYNEKNSPQPEECLV